MTSSTRGLEIVRTDRQQELKKAFDERLDPTQKRAIRTISQAAASADLALYLVGGAVRDLLLGRKIRDLDLAVEGPLEPLLDRLDVPITRHPGFGTATAEPVPGQRLDLACTRSESYPEPAALPRVRAADIVSDLGRRDFKSNALAVRIERGRPGRLLDPLEGGRDIDRRLLTILHPDSFVDDPTRALRAVRLAAELGFRLERATARALSNAREQGLFAKLSAARLRREVVKLLESSAPAEAVRLSRRWDLLGTFVEGGGRHATPKRLDWLIRRLDREDERTPNSPLCRWISLLALSMWPCASPAFTVARLQPRRRQRLALEQLPAMRSLARLVDNPRPRPSLIHEACDGVPVEILLAVAAAGSQRRRDLIDRYLGRWREIRSDIEARELLRRGIPRGPRLAAALRRALAAKIDGTARTAAQQLERALDESANS